MPVHLELVHLELIACLSIGFDWLFSGTNIWIILMRQRYSGLLEEDRSPKLGWFEYESVIRETLTIISWVSNYPFIIVLEKLGLIWLLV